MANFVENILDSVDIVLNTYIGDTFQNLTAGTAPFITSIVTLYLILMGIGVWTGKTQISNAEVIGRIFKIATSLGFFLSWPLFDGFIVAFLIDMPDALGAKMSGSTSETMTAALGDAYTNGLNFVGEIFSSSGWGLQYLLGAIVFIFVVAQVGYALFLILLSKIALSLLLALAPIFMVLFMFEATRKMVDTWIQQMLNYVAVILLTFGVLSITSGLTTSIVDAAIATGNTDLGTISAPVLIYLVSILIFLQINNIATAITGGFQIGTMVGAFRGVRRGGGGDSSDKGKKGGGSIKEG